MTKYRVMISETCSGYATIEADSEDEATEKAENIMDDEGTDGFPDFNPKHRDAEVLDVELAEGGADA